MILRRVIEHVRKQDWFAVFLDFIIVVVGVFVGLQVNNWNGALQDRSREASYLRGLATDVEADIAEIDEIIRVSTVRLSALGGILEANGRLPDGFQSARGRIGIEDAPRFSAQEWGSPGIAIFILTTFEGNRLSYDSMINAGDVALIRNASLMRAVQSYYATSEALRDFEESLKENRVQLVDAQQEAGLSPVDEDDIAELAAKFGAAQSLLAAAKNYWLYTNRHVKLIRDLRSQAQALLAQIEGEDAK
jgi:hypothetical protein